MKFAQDNLERSNLITAYEPDCVTVRGIEYRSSLLVMPTQTVTDWPVSDMEELTSKDLFGLLKHKPGLIIFGTGATQVFPKPAVFSVLMDEGIGYEIMDTAAACRTYNILIGEDRNVMAALIV